MPAIKQKFRGGTTHYPGEWVFNEYLSLLTMYMKFTPLGFDSKNIKKIKLIKKGKKYILIGKNYKTYMVSVGENSVNVQVYQKNKLIYNELIR